MCKSIGRFPEKPRDAITTVLADKVHIVCMFSAFRAHVCKKKKAEKFRWTQYTVRTTYMVLG